MARRADHTRQELTDLVLDAGIEIIEKEGFSKFSARQVAAKVGYTVGTLYHVFGSYDSLILHINGRTLDRWYDQLAESVADKTGPEAIHALAKDYIAFSAQHYHLWVTLFEHQVSDPKNLPDWYPPKMNRFFTLVEEILLPMTGHHEERARQTARILWAGIHGICMLSLSGKLDLTDSDSAETLAMVFVDSYLKTLS